MSDVRYVNSYIDVSVGLLHEYLNQILQLKTEAKLASDGMAERDRIIEGLNNTITSNDATAEEISKLRQQIAELENEANSLRNKASHVDTFANQINAMKTIIQEKDEVIATLNEEKLIELKKKDEVIVKLKTDKKQINTKSKPAVDLVKNVAQPEKVVMLKTDQTKVDDDF